MPSLFRFLTLIGVLGGLTYGAMFMLATWFIRNRARSRFRFPRTSSQSNPKPPEWPRRPKTQTKP